MVGDRVGHAHNQPVVYLMLQLGVFEVGIHAREGIMHGMTQYSGLKSDDGLAV